MRRHRAAFGAIAALVLLGLAGTMWLVGPLVRGQVGPLEFTLEAKKAELLLGEPLEVLLRLTNTSQEGVTSDFGLAFLDGRVNVEVAPEGEDFKPYVSMALALSHDMLTGVTPVTLKPGESLEATDFISYDKQTADLAFPEAGSYQVRVELVYDFGQQLLESAPVTVSVKGPANEDAQALEFIQQNSLQSFLTPEASLFPNALEALPLLQQFLEKFPNSTYAFYATQALGSVCGLYPTVCYISPKMALIADVRGGLAPLTVQFTLESLEPGANLVEYLWDFDGDDVMDETTTVPTASFTYTEEGTFTVTAIAVNAIAQGDVQTMLIGTKLGYHLEFEPPFVDLFPGEEVEVRLALVPVSQGLSAVDVEITFDPAVVQVLSVEPGDLLGTEPLVVVKEIDNENGVVRLAMARRGASPTPSPGGTLAHISVQVSETATSGSTTTVELRAVKLVDEAFNLVPEAEIVYQGQILIAIP